MAIISIDKYKTLDISRIDIKDDTYSFSFPEKQKELAKSIKKNGLLHPPILHFDKIICGRRRILACRLLGYNKIKIGLVNNKSLKNKNISPAISLFDLNIWDNLSIRDPNIIEKAIILNKLLYIFKLQSKNIINSYLKLLNIPQNNLYIARYLWLFQLPKNIKNAVLINNIALDTINLARDWPDKIRNIILNYIFSFGFGNNKIKEILNLITDIAVRENTSVEFALNMIDNKDHGCTLYQKGEKFTQILTKRRFPTHSVYKEKIMNNLNKLNLDGSTLVDANDLLSWESDTLCIKVKCRNKDELEKAIKQLNILKNSQGFKELQDLIKISV